jgi:polygalacturonase
VSKDWCRRNFIKSVCVGFAAAATRTLAAGAEPIAAVWQPQRFDVRAYGARGDGSTIDSAAINAAIAAAASAGGGMVFFPAGQYLSYSIRLASRVHLYLGPGSTIIAAPSPERESSATTSFYDLPEENSEARNYQDFGHTHWHNSLVWGDGLEDISITGPGTIWGKGLSTGQRADQPGVGNKSVAMKNCHNVLLRDFSILAGGHFGLLLTGVDNLTIENLKIDTNRDGMDIDCCRNVRVSNCTVNSPWDDGICPKSSFALGYARSTENVTITNCFVTGKYQLGSVLDGTYKEFAAGDRVWRTGRIKCGTESNGGFRNIAISNCVFDGCQGLALETVDGAFLEDITISNITMRDIVTAPIFLRLGARLRGPAGAKPGALRRVLISNIVSDTTAEKFGSTEVGSRTESVLTPWTRPYQLCSVISGIPGYPIEDFKLSDIYAQSQGGAGGDAAKINPPEKEAGYPEPTMFGPTPAHGLYIRHARNVEISRVEMAVVQSDARPAIVLDDVHRVDLVGVQAPYTAGQPIVSVRSGSDLRILQSRHIKDVQLHGEVGHRNF